ncbi:MAG: zinc ABC transporter substrate-binding protein [Verrucomicrobiota bacterium]
MRTMLLSNYYRIFKIAAISIIGTSLISCGSSEKSTTEIVKKSLPANYTAVCSVGMVSDIASKVIGNKGQVIGLMGEGVDPHLYKPTRDDVIKLTEADIVFYVGLMLEGRMSDTFLKIARAGTPVYPVTEIIDETYLAEPEGFEGHWDPHVWMDISAWSQCVTAIEKALSEQDPDHAQYYRSNAQAYLEELAQLEVYVKQVIASIPEEQRYLVTAHDAFGYFASAYGIKVQAAQGINTQSEAGVADINALVDFMVTNKIPALFVETTVADKNLRAVIEGAKAKSHEIIVGGELFSDAMGTPGTYEGTYIGMIDHNATVIAHALGGQAPEKGLNGKLSFQH